MVGKPVSAAQFQARSIHNPVLKSSSCNLNKLQPNPQHPFLKFRLRHRKKNLLVMDNNMYREYIEKRDREKNIANQLNMDSIQISPNKLKKLL